MLALREDLRGWDRAAIKKTLGAPALSALERDVAVPAQLASRAIASSNSVAALTRLFWLGERCGAEELQAAIPHTLAQSSPDGIPWLERVDDQWRARIQIVPVNIPAHLALAAEHGQREVVWIASSKGTMQGARHGEQYVMGVGGASRTLAALAGYHAGQRVLDLGTGSGIHAILAALCGADVVATDISESALHFAQFNAALNGVSIDLRCGSLYEPVAGEVFDVVVANPPFVITAAAAREKLGTLRYRDAGVSGDQLSRQVIAELPAHLKPAGRAWMLTNWEVADPKDIAGDVPSWIAEDLDVHLVIRDLLPVTSYIEMWLRDGGLSPADPDFAPAYQNWLEDFSARGVSHVGMGYLQAGSGQGSFIAQELVGAAPANLHEYMSRVWGNRYPGELANRIPLATDVVEHRFYRPGAADPFLIKFTQTTGFGYEMKADTALAGFVSVADGELTTGQIIAALADLMEVSASQLASELEPKLVELARLGMLIFDEPAAASPPHQAPRN